MADYSYPNAKASQDLNIILIRSSICNMKKIGFVVLSIIGGYVVFALLSGVVAFFITLLSNSGRNLSSNITTLIGIGAELIKWGLSIYGGIKIYKILIKKNPVKSSNSNDSINEDSKEKIDKMKQELVNNLNKNVKEDNGR